MDPSALHGRASSLNSATAQADVDTAVAADLSETPLVVMKINKGTGGHKGAWVLFTLKAP
ncbi:hypothetical protein [Streptomyces mirabilis]|uniref:hypothetical protein n=1 Tax=Streptomyces mirabilis TaxID=68239 RepID=UPI0036DD1E32